MGTSTPLARYLHLVRLNAIPPLWQWRVACPCSPPRWRVIQAKVVSDWDKLCSSFSSQLLVDISWYIIDRSVVGRSGWFLVDWGHPPVGPSCRRATETSSSLAAASCCNSFCNWSQAACRVADSVESHEPQSKADCRQKIEILRQNMKTVLKRTKHL